MYVEIVDPCKYMEKLIIIILGYITSNVLVVFWQVNRINLGKLKPVPGFL